MNKSTEKLLNIIAIGEHIENEGLSNLNVHKAMTLLGAKSRNGCNFVTLQKVWANTLKLLDDANGYKTACPKVRAQAMVVMSKIGTLKKSGRNFGTDSLKKTEINLEIAQRKAKL